MELPTHNNFSQINIICTLNASYFAKMKQKHCQEHYLDKRLGHIAKHNEP